MHWSYRQQQRQERHQHQKQQQGLLQPATSAATEHSNLSEVNQAIAAMYEHPALHDHVAGWAPVRSGQHNAPVFQGHLCTAQTHPNRV